VTAFADAYRIGTFKEPQMAEVEEQ
jgi:hypothetical protein